MSVWVLLSLFLFQDNEALMNVHLKDAVPNVPVFLFQDGKIGKQSDLATQLDTGVLFVLSADCEACEEALYSIAEIERQVPTYLVFVEEPSHQKAKKFSSQIPEARMFVLENQQLIHDLEIQALPAVLGYNAGALMYAYVGPIDRTVVRDIRTYFSLVFGE